MSEQSSAYFKPTPGPWIADDMVEPDNIYGWHGILNEQNGGVHAYVNTEANARLIAAAPELLKACEEADRAIRTDPLTRGMSKDGSLYAALMSIYEATQKAKGEMP